MAKELKVLIDELFSASHENERCPYIKRDEIGPYCSKDLSPNAPISEQRRVICDHFSLQLWCLDRKRCNKCIYYNGEKID